MNEKLTDEQIENWRRLLCSQIGPYALIMPKEEIQCYRDKMQERTDSINIETELNDIVEAELGEETNENKHFRQFLCQMKVANALTMSQEELQRYQDKIQTGCEAKIRSKICTCDLSLKIGTTTDETGVICNKCKKLRKKVI